MATMIRSSLVPALIASTIAVPAAASDKPRYAPAPAWVVPAPPIDVAKLPANAPVVLVYDSQQRIEGGTVSAYVETATRAATAEVLGQLGTVTLPWMPDKGDLIVHSAEILRGAETIDLIKGGEPFTVLRREQQLEQRTMTGLLTATMMAEGLRVGDVLRVRFTVTNTDGALKGRAQTIQPLPAAPFVARYARARMSWPETATIAFRSYADGVTPVPTVTGGFRTIEVPLPLAKPADLPSDIPARFQKPTILEATSFADWGEVSRTMAPLYATDGLIAPGSALAREIAKIRSAQTMPLARAAAALRFVQDEVRYLALGMNGGNYVAQAPTKTWEARYGDCKAKTLLLLAMLRDLGVTAEPVLASMQTTDLVIRRLPLPGAFDHVLVRAEIEGRSYWLDGTGNGARLEDIADTPPFGHVLPLRAAGTDLLAIEPRVPARPQFAITSEYDQRAGLDLPAIVTVSLTLRGALGSALNAAATQSGTVERGKLVRATLVETFGDMQFGESASAFDAASGTMTLTGRGVMTTPWTRDGKRRTMALSRLLSNTTFAPDRSRPAWRPLPAAVGEPSAMTQRTTIILPRGGAGFVIDRDVEGEARFANTTVVRTTVLNGDRLVFDERASTFGGEVAPAAIPAERAKSAQAVARAPKLRASDPVPARWEDVAAPGAAARLGAIDAIFTKAIAADPEEPSGYQSRASFRQGRYDWKGALADVDKLIALGGTADLHLQRATLYENIGDDAKALADAREALALDPSSMAAVGRVARLEARGGNTKAAMARLDEAIAAAGDERIGLINIKANIMARGGDVAGAIELLATTIDEQPNDTSLRNSRCWVKATEMVALDTALADCDRAIELEPGSLQARDSRALVLHRLGRTKEALAELDLIVDAAPSQADSLYLRGVLRKQSGNAAGAARDIAGALLMQPTVAKEYARWGLTA